MDISEWTWASTCRPTLPGSEPLHEDGAIVQKMFNCVLLLHLHFLLYSISMGLANRDCEIGLLLLKLMMVMLQKFVRRRGKVHWLSLTLLFVDKASRRNAQGNVEQLLFGDIQLLFESLLNLQILLLVSQESFSELILFVLDDHLLLDDLPLAGAHA